MSAFGSALILALLSIALLISPSFSQDGSLSSPNSPPISPNSPPSLASPPSSNSPPMSPDLPESPPMSPNLPYSPPFSPNSPSSPTSPNSPDSAPFSPDSPNSPSPPDSPPFSPDSPNSPSSPNSPYSPPFSPDTPYSPPDSPYSPPDSPYSPPYPYSPDSPYYSPYSPYSPAYSPESPYSPGDPPPFPPGQPWPEESPPPALPSPDALIYFVNQGDYEDMEGEFNTRFRTFEVNSSKFTLGLYESTPGAFTLGICMMSSYPKWVWAANRNNPVGERGTISLSTDGDLMLANVDGQIVWQAFSKGAETLQMQENGNFVLLDAENRIVWQSFDHPSDTLLPGQSLRGGARLVSRASPENNSEGNYTLEMPNGIPALYYKSENNPNPLPYYVIDQAFSRELTFQVGAVNASSGIYNLNLATSSVQQLAKTNYNSQDSFLRLDYDGILRTYTFDPRNSIGGIWRTEYTLFQGDPLTANTKGATECQLPGKCGEFGICYKDKCVACPSPKGLSAWTEGCAPPKLVGCSGGTNATYYRVKGVEHFSSMYTEGEGPMKQGKCMAKCSVDCKCTGYFYHRETARCWIVYDLKTLTKSRNSAHFGFIKMSN